MKRMLALFLVALMVVCLAACGEKSSAPTTVDKPGESATLETAPSQSIPEEIDPSQSVPDVTTPSGPEVSNEWRTIDMPAPTVPSAEKVTDQVSFTTADTRFDVNLYKAPWAETDPDAMLATLKALPFFEGWSWSKKYEEKAYGKLYSDVGQQRNYEYTVSLIATKPIDYISHRVSISFTGETKEYVGWKSISVNYSTPDTDMGATLQEGFMPVLKAVYGDYAEYMSHAPITDAKHDEMNYYAENDFGKSLLCRRMDERSVYFTAYSYTSMENVWEQYAGDYVSVLKDKEPEYFADMFGNIGSVNFDDIKTVGAGFFSKWFKDYDYTAPNAYDKLYTYAVEEFENGDKVVNFDLDMLVYQKDASFIEGIEFKLGYEVEHKNGTVASMLANLSMPAVCMDEVDADPDSDTTLKYLQDNLAYAKTMANAVFGSSYAMDDVHWNGFEDNKLWTSDKITIMAMEKMITFNFSTKSVTAIGKYRSSFDISIG